MSARTVEARAEALAERAMNKLDAELLAGRIPDAAYDAAVRQIDATVRRACRVSRQPRPTWAEVAP